jgi:5-methylcytosine-specific restriction protein A
MKFKLKAVPARVGTLNTARAPSLTTATQRITGYTLQQIRKRVLTRAQGMCECLECRRPGAVPLPAEVVDHVIPLWEGGVEDRHNDDNRQALSIPCHEKKSAEEAKRRAGR